MKKKKSLSSRELKLSCDFGSTKFNSTSDLSEISLTFHQPRVIEAVRYAMGVKQRGFNLFAGGPHELGKCEIVMEQLKHLNKHINAPKDWCYVHNFEDPVCPLALEFAPTLAESFKQNVDSWSGKLKELILAQAPLEPVCKMLDDAMQAIRAKYPARSIHEYLDQFKRAFLTDLNENLHIQKEFPFFKYEVNVFVAQQNEKESPIIYEYSPTKENLFGIIEYKTESGSVDSNFNLIKAGNLHRANGGYLLIDANKLILKSEVWEALKQALYKGKIDWSFCLNEGEGNKSASLMPQAIPLDVKIILIGSRSLYYMLCEEDPEFTSFFKVMADFSGSLQKSKKNNLTYARLIARLVTQNNLRHLECDAVKEVIRLSSRYVEDVNRVSLELGFLRDTLVESNYAAEVARHKTIKKEDVKKAYENKQARIARLPSQMLEDVQRKYILLDVKTSKIGQINGLTVEAQGDIAYGHPVRITAVARIGRSSEVVNIDREVDLSGSIHNKGMMILSSYVKGKYLLAQPLSISASVVFEQTYDGIDGDSASVAELMALLSAIAEVPIDQSLAVTGSINQHGEVQAVSGLNDKIESFFEICKQAGLTGQQGVIIPDSNRQNLILSDVVLAAIAAKKFNIYPIKIIDEAIPLLTGITAGRRNKYGLYPQDSFNFKVERRLKEFTQEVIEEKSGE